MSLFKVMMHSGVLVDVMDPDPSTLLLEDIAWHLGREPRFAGALGPPWHGYSVAHHSLVVAYLCYQNHRRRLSPSDLAGLVRFGLLHDGPEAVLRDIPRDVKLAMRALSDGHRSSYDLLEDAIMHQLVARYALDLSLKDLVKEADNDALAGEVELLWPQQHWKHFNCGPASPAARDAVHAIRHLSTEHARMAFVQAMAGCAYELSAGLFPTIGDEHQKAELRLVAAAKLPSLPPFPPDVG